MAQTIIVDTTPGYRMPTIYYSQGDIGRTFSIDLQSRFGESLPASPTITIQATKPSGLGFSVGSTSVSGAVVTFTVTETMSNEAGRFPAELKIVKNSVTLFTANFYIDCEANAHPEGTTDGDIDHIMPKFMSVTTTTLPAGDSATYSFDANTNTATFGIPKGADGSLASQVLAADYSSSKIYAIGDYVYYNGNLYRCTTAITTAEAWTSGHWTQVALANDVSDLKSDLTDITGGERIAVTTGYYINTSGSTVDVNNPTQNSGFSYAIEDCTEGEAFTINGTGGAGPRLWCFIDSSGNALTKSNASETLQNGTIIAPANTSKLVINFSGNGGFALKGYALNDAVSKGVELFGQFAFGRPIFEHGALANKAGVITKSENSQRARTFAPIPVKDIERIILPSDFTAYLFELDINEQVIGTYRQGSYFDISTLNDNCVYVVLNIYHTSGSSIIITDSDITSLNSNTVIKGLNTEVFLLKDRLKQTASPKILFESGTYANNSGTLNKINNNVRGRSIAVVEKKNIARITVPAIYTAILFKQDINENVISYAEGNDFDLSTAESSCIYVSLVVRHKWDSSLEITAEDIATLTNDTIVQYYEGNSPIGTVEVVHFTTSPVFNNTVYTDHGILVLPANYSETGTPTRLCIVCHGAGATKYEEKTMDETGKILGDPQRVLTKMGFAVMDCFAAPYNLVADLGNHLGNPTVQACYNAAYDYVMENYNLKNDGILLTGSSMGGLSMFGILTNNHIPVIAAVGYCPCVDLYKQAYCNPWSSTGRSQLATLYGFDGTAPTFTASYPPTDAEKQYFLDNFGKVIGYYPMLYNEFVGGFESIYSVLPASKYESDITEANVYNAFKKFVKAPLFIVHCDDDQVMASRYSKYLVNQLKTTGQLCNIKIYSSGGHGAWEAGATETHTDYNGNSFTCKESQWLGYTWLKNFD